MANRNYNYNQGGGPHSGLDIVITEGPYPKVYINGTEIPGITSMEFETMGSTSGMMEMILKLMPESVVYGDPPFDIVSGAPGVGAGDRINMRRAMEIKNNRKLHRIPKTSAQLINEANARIVKGDDK